ncbi:MAG: hypothetical protein ACREU8_12250 [Gammaproteobacteria bacterium]
MGGHLIVGERPWRGGHAFLDVHDGAGQLARSIFVGGKAPKRKKSDVGRVRAPPVTRQLDARSASPCVRLRPLSHEEKTALAKDWHTPGRLFQSAPFDEATGDILDYIGMGEDTFLGIGYYSGRTCFRFSILGD